MTLEVPLTLSRRQIRRVDALAVTDLKIPSIVLMENAGKNAAQWILQRYEHVGGLVHIVCGPGNNGGDGFVIARHLHNAGRVVRTCLVGDPARLTPDAATNHAIASAMGLPVWVVNEQEATLARIEFSASALIVDALLGTGFAGAVREPMAEVIRIINETPSHVVSIDVPSGLDCDTGEVGNVAIRAEATITFVALKRGFDLGQARDYLGSVVVVDIGTPPALARRVLDSEESR